MSILKKIATAGSFVLMGAGGVVLPVVGAPPVAAVTLGCGFSATTVSGAAISDHATTTSTVDLSTQDYNDPLVDLDVVLDLNHTFDDDLAITLSYGGHTVDLSSRNGGSGDNYANTRFDDGAATRITDGAAPFTGRFRPEQSLNAFDDLDPSGVWTLRVADNVTGDAGTLNSWGLVMRTQWCNDSDRDTVKNDDDLCREVKGVQPHGCPIRGRTVSISYNATAKEFRGILRCTTAPRCADTQPVRIYRVAAGADPLITRTFTNASGNYVFRKVSVSGQYYAVAPKVVEEGVAECRRAQSANVTP